MVNSASLSASPYPTPESLRARPSLAPAANNAAGAPQAQSSRPKRKQRDGYKIAKRRLPGDLRPTPRSGEHEDVLAHRLWGWLQRGATRREGDKKMMWRGRNVYVEDAISTLDEEARQRSRALPGGLQGYGGPPMAFPQPAGPLQAQPFGAPMPFPQPAGPLQAQQQFGAQMPLQQLGPLPAQPWAPMPFSQPAGRLQAQQFGAFMPPTMQQQATMPAAQTQLATHQPGNFFQGQQNPFPQPAPGQQVDYINGPCMTIEEQQSLGLLDPELAPAPALAQQADNLQGSQDLFSQPALSQQADNLQGAQNLFPQPALAQQVGNLQGSQNPFPQPALAQQADNLQGSQNPFGEPTFTQNEGFVPGTPTPEELIAGGILG
jgi:hypothetical protein